MLFQAMESMQSTRVTRSMKQAKVCLFDIPVVHKYICLVRKHVILPIYASLLLLTQLPTERQAAPKKGLTFVFLSLVVCLCNWSDLLPDFVWKVLIGTNSDLLFLFISWTCTQSKQAVSPSKGQRQSHCRWAAFTPRLGTLIWLHTDCIWTNI